MTIQKMMNQKTIKQLFSLAIFFLLSSCGFKEDIIDINALPESPPKDLQARLAWGLWKFDKDIINDALESGANPYALKKSIRGLPAINDERNLSPYAIPLEKYLKTIYMEQNMDAIKKALDAVAEIFELMISKHISVDEEVLTMNGNPTMREFISSSIARLNNERVAAPQEFNEESAYALSVLERIQNLL